MAYNFPDNPTLNQLFQGYLWDGEKWVAQNVTPTGAVRYDIVQGLSTPQQVQARANIGAGPIIAAGDAAWTAPTFQNGWANYGAPYAPCGFRKLPGGLVVLRGLCQGGTAAGIIFNLPVGYRPGIQLLFVVYTNPNAAARMDVTPAGDLSGTGLSNPWVSLANISFLAEN